MIGSNTSLIEFEYFTMVYVLTVMQELQREGLLVVDNLPGVVYSLSIETLNELSKKYPLPTYAELAENGYGLLTMTNRRLSFTQDDLRNLFITAQVNNGYIL